MGNASDSAATIDAQVLKGTRLGMIPDSSSYPGQRPTLSSGPEAQARATVFPLSANGLLISSFPASPDLTGTGTLIGPNMVLTAAHNLYSISTKQPAENVRFLPPAGFGESEVLAWKFPSDFVDSQGQREDFGLVILESRLGDFTGYLGIERNLNEKTRVRAALCSAERETRVFTGEVTGVTEDSFGVRGGPEEWARNGSEVWWCNDGGCVVGIAAKERVIRMTDARTKQISRWVADYLSEKHSRILRDYMEATYLRSLDLSKTRIGDSGLRYLAEGRSGRPQSLERLDVSGCQLTSEGIRPLVGARWYRLRELFLGENRIDSAGCAKLRDGIWPELHTLDLSRNLVLRAEGARQLARRVWPVLEVLRLAHTDFGPDGTKYLTKSSFPALIELDLAKNSLSSEGMDRLKRHRWEKLTRLDLSGNHLYRSGANHLSQASWPALHDLLIDGCMVGDEGIASLAKGRSWPTLRDLGTGYNEISSLGVEWLCQFAGWPELVRLDLRGNKFAAGEDEMRRIRQKWNAITVVVV